MKILSFFPRTLGLVAVATATLGACAVFHHITAPAEVVVRDGNAPAKPALAEREIPQEVGQLDKIGYDAKAAALCAEGF